MRPQLQNLSSELLNLALLLFDSIDKCDAEAIILDAFDLAFLVAKSEQRLDLGNIFGAKAHVARAALLPGETNRPQSVDDVQATDKRCDVGLVAQARRVAGSNLIEGVTA